MATYGDASSGGMARLEVDPETGEQRVVYDTTEERGEMDKGSWLGALGRTAGQIVDPRKSALPYILGAIAAPGVANAVGGALGGGGGGAAAATTAASTSVPTATGGGLAGLFGPGGIMGKVATGGKILGGILNKSAENRQEGARDALLAGQLDQQAARDLDRAALDRAEMERKDLESSQKQSSLNYDRALQAQRKLDHERAMIDPSGFKTKPNIPMMTGGKNRLPSEQEREYLKTLRDQAIREAMNPTKPSVVPGFTPAPRVQMPKAGLLERIAGPAALAMRLFGGINPDEDTQIRRPVSVGDATRGGDVA